MKTLIILTVSLFTATAAFAQWNTNGAQPTPLGQIYGGAPQSFLLLDGNGEIITPAFLNNRTNATLIDQMISHAVTPQQFGAVGNGSTDDTAAFQSMLNSGGQFFIPPATYLVSNLFLTNNTHLFGAPGAVLLQNASATNYVLSTGNNVNIQIENIVVDGGLRTQPSATLATRHGIYFNAQTNGASWIRYCEAIGFNGYGFTGVETGGVLTGQAVNVGSFDHLTADFDCIGLNQPEISSASAEYSQWTACQSVNCAVGLYNVAGNIINSGFRVSDCGTGIQLVGPGSNGQHGIWNGTIINHNTVGISANGIADGEQFNGGFDIAGTSAFVLNDCVGVVFNGMAFAIPSTAQVVNSPAPNQNLMVNCMIQGDYSAWKAGCTNDGGLFALNSFSWNQNGSALTNTSDGSYGNTPFAIKPYSYALRNGLMNGAGTYSGTGQGQATPSTYLDDEAISWAGNSGTGLSVFWQSQPIVPESTASVYSLTILNTGSSMVITNLKADVLYFGNSGRQYVPTTIYPTYTLTTGYNTILMTNQFTNSVIKRDVGFETGQGSASTTLYLTRFTETPLQ